MKPQKLPAIISAFLLWLCAFSSIAQTPFNAQFNFTNSQLLPLQYCQVTLTPIAPLVTWSNFFWTTNTVTGPTTDTNGTSIFTNLLSGAAYQLNLMNGGQNVLSTNVGFPNGLTGLVNAAPYQGMLSNALGSNVFYYSITNWNFQTIAAGSNVVFTVSNGVTYVNASASGGGTTNIATNNATGLLLSNDWSRFNLASTNYQPTNSNLTTLAGNNGGNLTNGVVLSLARDFGVVGGRGNDETAKIQAALNSLRPVLVDIECSATNLFIPAGAYFIGDGTHIIIQLSTAPAPDLFFATNNAFIFDGIIATGGQGPANNNGIHFNNLVSAVLINCAFDAFTASGYVCDGFGASFPQPTSATANIMACSAGFCANGFCFTNSGEYVELQNCEAQSCTRGVYIGAGNVNIIGGIFTKNGTGIYVDGVGPNPAHGIINGSTINHNSTGVVFTGFPNGEILNNCLFLGQGATGSNDICITNCAGVVMQGCYLNSSQHIICDGTGGAGGPNFLVNPMTQGYPTVIIKNGGVLLTTAGFLNYAGATIATNTMTNAISGTFTGIGTGAFIGDASALTGLTAGQIPNLAGSIIASGSINQARIPQDGTTVTNSGGNLTVGTNVALYNASGVFGGTQTFSTIAVSNITVNGPQTNLGQTIVPRIWLGTNTNCIIDWTTVGSAGGIYVYTPITNCGIYMTNLPTLTNQAVTIQIKIQGTNSTVTWGTNTVADVLWPGNITPVQTTNNGFQDIYSLTYDGTTNIHAAALQRYSQ